MSKDDGAARSWAVTLLLLALAVGYVSIGFWRGAPAWLPSFAPWMVQTLASTSPDSSFAARVLITDTAVGMIVPAGLWVLAGRRLADTGLGMPNLVGVRMILVSIAVAIPFGLWLNLGARLGEGNRRLPSHYALYLLTTIPEHALLCGAITALMLPARRLPDPVPMAPIEGSLAVRTLRWLALAQPSERGALGWFGLAGPSLFAIVASGAVFGLIHVGKPDPLEVMLSFPGGVAVAYVTLRSHSIWPGVVAHWAMNLVPLGFFLLLR